MLVPDVVFPGTWLQDADPSWAIQISGLLQFLVGPLDMAAVALDAYGRQKAQWATSLGMHLSTEEKSAQRMAKLGERSDWIRARATECGLDPEAPTFGALQEDLEAAYDRAQWQTGSMPYTYEGEAVRAHARSFLFALDRLSKIVGALLKDARIPAGVHTAAQVLQAEIPDLMHLRDSIAHYEDRIRRRGQRGAIEPQAVDEDFLRAPAGTVMINESLSGDRFGSTTADGRHVTVEVSEATLTAAQRCVQAVLDAFSWSGPRRRHPSWQIAEL